MRETIIEKWGPSVSATDVLSDLYRGDRSTSATEALDVVIRNLTYSANAVYAVPIDYPSVTHVEEAPESWRLLRMDRINAWDRLVGEMLLHEAFDIKLRHGNTYLTDDIDISAYQVADPFRVVAVNGYDAVKLDVTVPAGVYEYVSDIGHLDGTYLTRFYSPTDDVADWYDRVHEIGSQCAFAKCQGCGHTWEAYDATNQFDSTSDGSSFRFSALEWTGGSDEFDVYEDTHPMCPRGVCYGTLRFRVDGAEWSAPAVKNGE